MEARSLLVLGDGSFAVEALDIAEAAGGFKLPGFVNSIIRPDAGVMLEGLPVFWVNDIPFGPAECDPACAIVTTMRRAFMENMRGRGYGFRSLVHPSAGVSRRAHIQDGCILNTGAVVGSNADLGEYTIVNRGALIGHDNRTGRCCTISPGANLAGGVEIGDGALIGQGAVIRERFRIGEGSTVAAGAIVLKDVQAHCLFAEIPARIIKSGVNGY